MYCERYTPFEATNYPGALPSNPLASTGNPLASTGNTVSDAPDRSIQMDTTEHAFTTKGNLTGELPQPLKLLRGPVSNEPSLTLSDPGSNKYRSLGNYPLKR